MSTVPIEIKLNFFSNSQLVIFHRNPNLKETGEWEYISWPKYNSAEQKFIVLDKTVQETGSHLRINECAFWSKFMPKIFSWAGKILFLDIINYNV